jgi:hypothetical protein
MLAVLALTLPASAFAPSDSFFIGIEPQRVEWFHPHEQARLSRESRALASFRAAEGAGWSVRWDETTRTPLELYGAGIPLPTTSEAELVAALTAQLVARADLLGFDPAQLRLRSASRHEPSDTWYVDFDVERDPGVPTYRGGLSARVKHGNLILLRAGTAPASPVTGAWAIDPRKAIDLATAAGPAPAARHDEPSVERRLLERWTPNGLELRRTFLTRTRTADPPGIWVSFVDAETGQLLSVHNEVRFVNGTVEARHHERSPLGGLITSPMPLVRVQGSSTTFTDEDGNFTLNSGPFTSTLDGDYLNVDNRGGGNGVLQSSAATFEWTTAAATQAEIDTYVFAHQAREWGLAADPTSGMALRNQQANVNLNQVCNAYYDGQSINFFRAGGGCTNTGENGDVVHHEWGHGFHAWQIRSGTFDGSLSEGASDAVAFFYSGNNYIGPGFFNNGGAIRDVSPNRVYPNDFVNNQYAVHDNGLIFGGAMWDTWGFLIETLGESAGTRVAESIFAGLLRGGPTIPQSFTEALVADDDDGNLGNGTPHSCQLVLGFAPHGLAQGATAGGLEVVATHEPVVATLPGVETPVRFALPPANDCFSGVADDAVIRYRVNGGDWESVNARPDGDKVRGDLPPFDEGDFVEYWMEGSDLDDNRFVSPASGRVAPFTMYVGATLEVDCIPFGADDGGFNGKVVAGIVSNPWDYGAPTGEGGDPAAAFTGNKTWGTELGNDGLYPANATVRLRSPDLATAHYEGVFLQYRRWLSVEDKQYDQAWIEVNGEKVWQNGGEPEGTGNTTDDGWISHAVDLGGVADRGSAQVDFYLGADDGVEFGGWTIDDLCLLAPDTPDNRLGIGDLAVIEEGGFAGLTWTHPKHGPVERVVLVKRADRFPESWEDGTILADIASPEPGSPGRAVDAYLAPDNFYAVYASDGASWSSFTIEGLNAVEHEREGAIPGAEGIDWSGEGGAPGAPLGCACDGSGASGGAVGGALLGAALAFRRRRAR